MLSWLRRALGTQAPKGQATLINVGTGGFNFEVVGEQSYQTQLRGVSAGRVERGERVTVACRLRWEMNSHTHAPAVRVDSTDGRTLGYLRATEAAVYATAFYELERGGHVAECQGVLVGGQPEKPSLGIWLDFKPKLLA
jgi:hypothetical protein